MKTPTSAETSVRPSTAFSRAEPSTAVSPAGTSINPAMYGRKPRPSAFDGRSSQQAAPALRRYEIACLNARGDIETSSHIAPAVPLFEAAVSAFARGTLISTPTGEVAIEDLLPGDKILTGSGNATPVQWIGSTIFRPDRPSSQTSITHMTRVMADAFGISRPSSYMMAGPAARILHTPDHLRASSGAHKMLTPLRGFVDGETVIEVTPPAPIELFHLCLKHHAIIFAGGLEVESYHPGNGASHAVSHNLRQIYLSMFDHIHHIADFGPMIYPHAPDDRYQDGSAA